MARGGKREGAGRPRKEEKVALDQRQSIADINKQRAFIMYQLHEQAVIDAFLDNLKNGLKSKNLTERKDANRMVFEILMKTNVPAEEGKAENNKATSNEIIRKLKEERQSKPNVGESDMDSNEGD